VQEKIRENMFQQKDDYCCYRMKNTVEKNTSTLFYRPHLRRYAIKEKHKNTTGTMSNIIDFCLWCGQKLPEDLASEWEKILVQDYKIENPWSAEYKRCIPQEFLTDEWWRKRCL
jgi:hypothetical protein